jgi:hypothetical protein
MTEQQKQLAAENFANGNVGEYRKLTDQYERGAWTGSYQGYIAALSAQSKDAEERIKKLGESLRYYADCYAKQSRELSDKIERIAELEAQLQTAKIQHAKSEAWVSVKDKLPENSSFCNDEVLFVTGGIIHNGCYDYEDGFWHERYGGKYLDILRIERGEKQNGGIVTHWMPLPPPPDKAAYIGTSNNEPEK